jgi:hypothetical protein
MDPILLTAELWFDREPPPSALAAPAPGAVPPPTTEQTWDFDGADAVLARCAHSRLVTGADREAFVAALCAAIEDLAPAAVWLPLCERVAEPATILHDRELAALVNVRMFAVDGTDQRLLETLGLHALGLPDVQCVAEPDEPASIAALLYDVAGYLLQSGDVIEDGDTIGNRPWRCHDATSVVAPERRMLTLSPD